MLTFSYLLDFFHVLGNTCTLKKGDGNLSKILQYIYEMKLTKWIF